MVTVLWDQDKPTHLVKHPAFGGTKYTNPASKPTLKKRLPCDNIHATLCGTTKTNIIDDQRRRANTGRY
jgi:hypothetical protein